MTGLSALVLTGVLQRIDEAPAAEDIKPGWVALVLVITLGVVTVLLWTSMRKRLGKIRFDDPPRDRPGSGEDRPARTEEP